MIKFKKMKYLLLTAMQKNVPPVFIYIYFYKAALSGNPELTLQLIMSATRVFGD